MCLIDGGGKLNVHANSEECFYREGGGVISRPQKKYCGLGGPTEVKHFQPSKTMSSHTDITTT